MVPSRGLRSTELRDLSLNTRANIREDQAELLRTGPANRGAVDDEWIGRILWEDATFQVCPDQNSHGTPDATSPR